MLLCYNESMLINVGLRTDIVWFYSDWLFNRFREGYVYSRNPLFTNKVTSYQLSPDKVDAVLFCSKNYEPALPRLHEITNRFRTLFHFTLNGYGHDIEPAVPSVSERLETLKELSKLVGKQRLFWRYDPILVTPRYPPRWHDAMFDYLAEQIAPYVSGCIVNFVDVFIKLSSRIPEIVRLTGEDKRHILLPIADAAERHNLPVRCCAMGIDYGIPRHGCITLEDISRANGCRFRDIKHVGNQRKCQCIISRDIGWYDSCPGGCRYCNANHTGDVQENFERHDPHSPLLIGSFLPTDSLFFSPQESFLIGNDRQISLFDL